jgi:lysophospholipase L1-like esterase
MTPRFFGLLASVAGLAFVVCFPPACSSSTTTNAAPVSPGDDGGGSDGGTTDDGGEGGTTPTPEGGTIGGATIPEPTACPTAKFKTLVVLGDSISDVGAGSGADEEPFYRTLLVKNDDVKYPDYKGFDLATCMQLDPTAGVVKASLGGAVATVPKTNDPTDKSVLLNQATGLPKTLTGPVLVVGTIGGNDVQRGLVTVLTGTPAQVQMQIDAFAAGFGAAMAELTKPDRFGAGVKVTVLMTNVYDPSGGTGHFYYQPKMATCPGALGFWPDKKETASALAPWNTAMANEAAKYPDVKLLELAAPFVAHQVSTPDPTNWFHEDCIHPNSLGQNAVRGVFWNGLMTLP